MDFQYSQEQQLLVDSLSRLLDKDYDFEARKRVIASDAGYSLALWEKLAELGLLGLAIPQDDGGFGGGALDLVGSMEAFGRALILEPFVPTVALAARLIVTQASPEQRARWLPSIAEGRACWALAHAEAGARYELSQVLTQAQPDGEGWLLDGEKHMALYAPMAQHLLVSARIRGASNDPEGIALFVVDPKAARLEMRSFRTQDNLRAADIRLTGVRVSAADRVGGATGVFDGLVEAIDFASVLSCAEAVGAMRYACESTLEYLKTRRQFGVPIGSFQALQHRLVDMFVSAEQARSITLLACSRFDGASRGSVSANERMRIVSAAKIKIAEAARHVGQEAVQLHGGMGMTQEMKVAHTFKRLTMLAQWLGDADHHLERFAALD
jgi:alkylation response protein AidB-like acyl-CoA dehydrogenase